MTSGASGHSNEVAARTRACALEGRRTVACAPGRNGKAIALALGCGSAVRSQWQILLLSCALGSCYALRMGFMGDVECRQRPHERRPGAANGGVLQTAGVVGGRLTTVRPAQKL
jgi:hypothetical protein